MVLENGVKNIQAAAYNGARMVVLKNVPNQNWCPKSSTNLLGFTHSNALKEVFSENFVLMYDLYSRAACNQERVMMARVR